MRMEMKCVKCGGDDLSVEDTSVEYVEHKEALGSVVAVYQDSSFKAAHIEPKDTFFAGEEGTHILVNLTCYSCGAEMTLYVSAPTGYGVEVGLD